MHRRALRINILLLPALLALSVPVAAQQVLATPLDSARARPQKPKSVGAAVVMSVFLPGSGQIYAGQGGRGLLTMAAYFPAAFIVNGGRTDGVGKVAGLTVLSLYVFSLVDAGRSAQRYNASLKTAARDADTRDDSVPLFVEASSSRRQASFASRGSSLCSCVAYPAH